MNKYNPNIHHRRSIRLKGYDYSMAGLYFITICCQNRAYFFGEIRDGQMALNDYGKIAFEEWLKLPRRFKNFELDVFQIMPNHMHGIIILKDISFESVKSVGAGFTPAQNEENITVNGQLETDNGQPQGIAPTIAPTIGDIVGAYKSLVANGCLKIYKSKSEVMGKLSQRDYYEHIIRDERAYHNISEYIINNPVKWEEGKFYN